MARVVLRDFRLEDLDAMAYWLRPEHEWQRFDAPYFAKPGPDEVAATLERIRGRIRAGVPWETPRLRRVVADAETDALVGTVSRYWESEETDWLAIGIALYDPACWRRGLGTEALALWTSQLFAEMPRLVRLGLRTWSGNVGMIRVAEKLGFREEARFRRARIVDGVYYDALGFGVLREEWAARSSGDVS